MAGNGLIRDARAAHPRRRPARGAQPRRADGRLRAHRRAPRRVRQAGRRGVPLHARAPTPRGSATVTCSTSAAMHGRGRAPAGSHPRAQRVPDLGGVFFLSDIDLTGFGPYYGDVWSDLEDFEASLGAGPRRGRRLLRHVPPQGRDRGPRGVRRAGRRVHRRDRPPARGDARVPRRAAHDRRHGGPPLHLPTARAARLRRQRRTPVARQCTCNGC